MNRFVISLLLPVLHCVVLYCIDTYVQICICSTCDGDLVGGGGGGDE